MTPRDPNRRAAGEAVRWLGEPGMGGWYTAAEHTALAQVLTEMPSWTGSYSRRHQEAFENAFATYSGAAFAVCLNSGGVALDIAMACLDAEPGAEVLSCVLNFPGTHLAVLGAGLRLVLAEPDPATLNLDPAEISHRMTEFQAAVGLVQLTRLDGMNGRRIDLARERTALLAATPGVHTPAEFAGYRHVYYLYNLLLTRDTPPGTRDHLMAVLRTEHGVGAVVANPPTYRVHPLIAKETADQGPFPVAEDVADRLLCLALHPLMSDEDNTQITNAVLASLRTAGIE